MSDAVLLAIVACIQALGVAITNVLIKRNACGSENCKKHLNDALRLKSGKNE